MRLIIYGIAMMVSSQLKPPENIYDAVSRIIAGVLIITGLFLDLHKLLSNSNMNYKAKIELDIKIINNPNSTAKEIDEAMKRCSDKLHKLVTLVHSQRLKEK